MPPRFQPIPYNTEGSFNAIMSLSSPFLLSLPIIFFLNKTTYTTMSASSGHSPSLLPNRNGEKEGKRGKERHLQHCSWSSSRSSCIVTCSTACTTVWYSPLSLFPRTECVQQRLYESVISVPMQIPKDVQVCIH